MSVVSAELQSTEKSEVVRKMLGDHVFNAFIANKMLEWDEYRTQATQYELQRYLPVFQLPRTQRGHTLPPVALSVELTVAQARIPIQPIPDA